jgi:hypothetical protein
MRRKTYALATEEDLLIDLTFHKVSASLVAEFKEKIVDPPLQWKLEGCLPRPHQQNPPRTGLYPLSHNTHPKLKGDFAHG